MKVLAAVVCCGYASMYDVLNPELLPPSSCKTGCAPWTEGSIWRGGKVPTDAGRHCAQIGSLANSRPYGAWCFCNSTTPPPVPTKDHPLDGQTLAMRSNATGKYVSFAYTDAPQGLAGGSEWMRAAYDSNPDAMPLLFKAVEGKPHTYTLYNQWTGYENWVSFTWTSNYMRSYYGEADAAPFEFKDLGGDDHGKYVVINHWDDPRSAGKYVNLDDSTWLQTTSDQSGALVVVLEEAAGPAGGTWGYCEHGEAVPEQINVQVAGPDSVVIVWVTFEKQAPTEAPVVSIAKKGEQPKELQGVTHEHVTPAGDRTYYMHFVRVGGLAERASYSYTVRSGGAGAATSAEYTFRAPYSSGETKVDIYGDMGIYEYNNMDQLYKDCVEGTAADLIIHMGDHAYNEGDSDERRADGYFSGFQKTVANCPWVPVVGNHEYYSSEELSRYMDSTWQKWGPVAGGNVSHMKSAARKATSTATSALGALLSTGLHHGPGSVGDHPSNTSRYFSMDVGLMHLVALDLNGYYGCDPCGEQCKKAQLDWFEEDLRRANLNREKTPWLVVFSHFPVYCTGCHAAQVSGEFYASDAAETLGNGNATAARAWDKANLKAGAKSTTKASQAADETIKDFVPLFDKYSVDLYAAGHWHYYESLWPAAKGNETCLSCAEPTQLTFEEPKVTVHVTTGNGGPPGKDTFCESGSGSPDCDNIPATRMQTNEFSYGRLVAHNATHLTFQQIFNINGSVFDEFVVVQSKHPFNQPVEVVV
mmetsp:Transcript_64277/g.172041  ORF Transcript_64277/g.172041 Transcript_64277/m.172041 type:complete len:756 (-) Transcript_64277:30-2297(-)